MRKLLSLLMAMFLVFTGTGSMSVFAEDETASTSDSYIEINDMGSRVFTYVAEHLNDPTPMMTPVMFVWADEDFESVEDVRTYAEEKGFKQIADDARGALVFLNPVNETYGEEDIQVYDNITVELAKSENQFGFVTYQNLMYGFGEGRGASFVHNYMSLHANRIAAVMTVGGELDAETKSVMSLPAYLVNPSEAVVDYYKTANHTDTETQYNGKNLYYNSSLSTEKVVVDHSEETGFSAELVSTAWNELMRKITRNVIGRCVWAETYNIPSGGRTDHIDEVFTLMDRIVPEEAGLRFNENVKDAEAYGDGYWFEWIPEEALSADNTKEYPLVVNLHGSGDHPVFEAEGNGWIEVAAKERLIVISPEWQINNGSADAEVLRNLIDHICEKYPVDKSRIYVTGFSAGGMNTIKLSNTYPEYFAAAAPLAPPFGSLDLNEDSPALPILFGTGEVDMYSGTILDENNPSVRALKVSHIENVLNHAFKNNGVDLQIDTTALDYDAYPFYGFDTSKTADSFLTKHGHRMTINSFKDEKNITRVKLLIVDGMEHNHYTEFAPHIWEFFKNFSRNTETGESVYHCPHEHTHVDETTAVEPTCTENGKQGDTICDDCGEVVSEGEVIAATGHKVVVVDKKDATCTEEGYTGNQVCETCGELIAKGEVIPATGEHHYNEKGVCKNFGAKKTASAKTPKTGDSSNIFGYMMGVCFLLAAAGAALYVRMSHHS